MKLKRKIIYNIIDIWNKYILSTIPINIYYLKLCKYKSLILILNFIFDFIKFFINLDFYNPSFIINSIK